MDITQLAVLMGGVFCALALMIFAFSGPNTGKGKDRRLGAIRDRHTAGAALTIETQLRKVQAARSETLESLAQKFIPNPAVMRLRLEKTGKSWQLGSYVGICASLTIAVGIAVYFAGMPAHLAIPVGLFLGLGLPHFVVGSLIKRRLGKFNVYFPDAIDLMVRGLRSGLPISETLGVVAAELPDPLAEEFRMCVDKIRIGRTMEAALQEMADRLGTPEVQFFCITLAIQRETGGNLSETLSNLSEVLRKRAAMKLKIKAMSSESKASAYIIGVLPFLVFGIIYSVNPPYMGRFFTDERLIAIGLGGIVWMGIGAAVMAKMINFEI
jgi:tight adherence protein B